MKKIITVILISIYSLNLQSQDCNLIAKKIIQKIRLYQTDELLTYYDKVSKKWGFMSKKGEILTQPLCMEASNFESDNETFYLYNYSNCVIKIDLKKFTYKTNRVEKNIENYYTPYTSTNIVMDSIFKGFKVQVSQSIDLKNGEINKFGDITSYSNYYSEVNDLFYYKNKFYAVATLTKNKTKGIIDEEGNIINGFDFKFKSIKLLEYYKGEDKNEPWFYFENNEQVKGFINLEGSTILKDEILSHCNYSFDYYSIQKNEDKSGLLDLRTLKWVIKPQTKLKFESIFEINKDYNNRFFYIEVSKDSDKFLIDLDSNEYKPVIKTIKNSKNSKKN